MNAALYNTKTAKALTHEIQNIFLQFSSILFIRIYVRNLLGEFAHGCVFIVLSCGTKSSMVFSALCRLYLYGCPVFCKV